MQNDFANQVVEQIEKSGVDPGLVTFEITESVAAGDYGFLERLMSGLREREHRFAMDDYGTGYSNISYMYEMPFSIIKIDKSILWKAKDPRTGESEKNGYIYLENTIHMLKEMGYSVLVEGVETVEQKMLLEELGCDYLQGYYFSKPVQKQVFTDFIKVVNT